MTVAYEPGDSVPRGLFCVDGEREVRLEFEIPVRIRETADVRHVYPDVSIHGVDDVVSLEESSPHATIFEGVNTVLYFDPMEE
jgi:hypothetical protein